MELIEDSGLTNARLSHDPHHLSPALCGLCQQVGQGGQLPLPSHESTQRSPSVQAQWRWPRPETRHQEGLNPRGPCMWLALAPALDEAPDLRRHQNLPRHRMP